MEQDTMGNVDRLLGKLEQFMTSAEARAAADAQDHREFRQALDDLKAFKWKVIGVSLVASTCASAILTAVLSNVRFIR